MLLGFGIINDSIDDEREAMVVEDTYEKEDFDDSGNNENDNNEIYNIPPTVQISSSVISGMAPLKVQFYSTCDDPDGKLIRYHWDFDNGDSSEVKNPIYTFQYAGTYQVTLLVEDNNDGKTENFINITVLDNIPPTVSILTNNTEGMSPLTVQFDANVEDSDGEIVSYYWDFKDGTHSNKKKPSHTFHYYDSSGLKIRDSLFYVNLTVTDNNGAIATDEIIIRLNDYNMSVIDVDYRHPYSNEVWLDVKIDTSKSLILEKDAFQIRTESGNKYWIDRISKNLPDTLGAETSTIFTVVFEGVTYEEKVAHLMYWGGDGNILGCSVSD